MSSYTLYYSYTFTCDHRSTSFPAPVPLPVRFDSTINQMINNMILILLALAVIFTCSTLNTVDSQWLADTPKQYDQKTDDMMKRVKAGLNKAYSCFKNSNDIGEEFFRYGAMLCPFDKMVEEGKLTHNDVDTYILYLTWNIHPLSEPDKEGYRIKRKVWCACSGTCNGRLR